MMLIESLEIAKMNSTENSLRIIEGDIPLKHPLGERTVNGYILDPESFKSAFDRKMSVMPAGSSIPIVLKKAYDYQVLDRFSDAFITRPDDIIGYAMSIDDDGKNARCKFINYQDDMFCNKKLCLCLHVMGKITNSEKIDEDMNYYVDVKHIIRLALDYEE